MQQYDMIVLGAGISGLSMAHYCQQHGLNTLVLEKTARVRSFPCVGIYRFLVGIGNAHRVQFLQ